MELLKSLNKEQKQAVTHEEGPLLIVAGAGTGKTTVITQRVAWLITQGKARSDEILALTFTNKAAGEMEERVDRLLPLGYLDLWISTFHSFCQRILEEYAIDIGLPHDFKLLDQTAQWLLVRQNLDKFDLDYYRPLGNPTKFIHALLKHFSRAKDEAISPQDYLSYVEGLRLNLDVAESTGGKSQVGLNKFEERSTKFEKKSKLKTQKSKDDLDISEIKRLDEVANAYHIYQQILVDNNALDFGDLINYTLQLFQKRPKVLAKYRQQFKYILVDEFQDTNWVQYELIKLLAAPDNNLTLVGDDEQSIYKFRGASVSNILQFHSDYPDAEFITLITNYRSLQEILDESHKFIQLNSPNRLEGKVINGKKIDKKLKAHQAGKAKIEYLLYEDQYKEAVGVVQKITEIIKSENIKHNEIPRQARDDSGAVTYNDFAILVRANSLADPFVAVFESAGVPYQHFASRGLYTKAIILDIINFLKLLDDYHESPALWRVLNWPVFSLKAQTLVGINHYARKKAWSLYQAVYWWQRQGKIDKAERDELGVILGLISRHTKMAQTKRPREVILSFLEESGYLKWLSDKENIQAMQQLSFLEQFDARLKAFETESFDPSIKNFMDEMKMELESGESGSLAFDPDSGPEAVKILTIHAAKGLEFKHVFIAGLVDKRFPSIDRRDPIELPDELIKEQIPEGDIHLQEERRLMYVAMTRAKFSLFLTRACDYGGKTKKKPSRFLHELGLAGQEQVHSGTKSRVIRDGVIESPDPIVLASRDSRVATQYKLPIPKRFSFTQMKSFEACPYQYRFSNILKVPVRANFTLSFGKTMHATLKRFLDHIKESDTKDQGDIFNEQGSMSKDQKKNQEKNIPSLKELLKIYEEEWLDDWYESPKHKEEYREKGKQILKNFHAKVLKDTPKAKYLEQGFNLKVLDTEIKQVHSFFGVIDRVDIVEDGVEIIDYKTGTVKSEKNIEKDQLLIYQIAANEVLGLKPKKLTFYYLNENKPVSFLGSEKELDKMKKKILDFARKVQESDFRATPSPHTCKYCDYRNICEFRQI